MSGVPSKLAAPTTLGRVFVVVDPADRGWASDLIAVEPGPVVYTRRGGIWLRDKPLEKRLAARSLLLRELRNRALVSTEVARFDASRADAAVRAVRLALPKRTQAERLIARAEASAEQTGTPVEAKVVDLAARRAAAVNKFEEVSSTVTASAGAPRSADELRASYEDRRRRRERREARRGRRAEDARRDDALVAAMRAGAAVTFADVRR